MWNAQDDAKSSLQADLVRAVKLLHMTPALMKFITGGIWRQERHDRFTKGEINHLIDWLFLHCQQSSGERTTEDPGDETGARRARDTKLAHEREGITRAASALSSPGLPPGNRDTHGVLRRKHPTQEQTRVK